MVVYEVVVTLGVMCMLFAEAREHRLGQTVGKVTASTAFVAAALSHGAPTSAYGRGVVVALVLSWFGDVLLIPKSQRVFLAGILAFLSAHVAYGRAFVVRGVEPMRVVIALGLALIPGALLGRYFVRHAPAKLRPAVVAYIVVLSSMVALALGTRGDVRIPVAAAVFYASDISVALNRFVRPSRLTRAWGAPLYFGAQLVFAATVWSTP